MSEDELPRAVAIMDPADFEQLYSLFNDCNWLKRSSAGVLALWNKCQTQGERDLINDLIRRFYVADSNLQNDMATSIAKVIERRWNLSADDSIIVAISDDGDADGSQAFLQIIKNKFDPDDNWTGRSFVNSVPEGLKRLNGKNNMVLLDDFIGTGETMISRYRSLENRLAAMGMAHVKMYVTAAAGMENARDRLLDEKIDTYCPVWLKKGISGNYSGVELPNNIAHMKRLEQDLAKTIKRAPLQSFGYQQSESLFCMQDWNVPDNVFPIFWWPKYIDKSRRPVIFRRI
ncbi:hypothetical protein [Emcibacter sp. SYSU 3D8]|uniref:phosphoribosyltransferase-like protein n=1 Tax=Emcibacter sp. SYSU 3D8 TaxID=3133969 RepID=UPI0031FE6331